MRAPSAAPRIRMVRIIRAPRTSNTPRLPGAQGPASLARSSLAAADDDGRLQERQPHGVAERSDLDELEAGDPRGLPSPGSGHDRPGESEPGCLTEAPLQPADRAQLAEQADLADRDGPRQD